jgi:hypothetical protein
MRCPARIAAFTAICVWAMASACAKPAVTGFSWKAADGTSRSFAQAASWEAGAEGRFSPSRLENRYFLERSIAVGAGRCLEICVAAAVADEAEHSLRFALSSRRDGGKPFISARFPVRSSFSRFTLPLPEGSLIASLSVTAEFAGSVVSATKEGGRAPSMQIAAIANRPVFRGYSLDAEGPRVSAGFSYVSGRGESLLSIESPFEGIASPSSTSSAPLSLVLAYGKAETGTRIHIVGKSREGTEVPFDLLARGGGGRLVLGREAFPAGISLIEAHIPSGISPRAFYVEAIPADEAELADLGRVLRSSASQAGADYDLYRWDLLPSVLILDFADYSIQDRYLKRIAFFVEKAGYRGSLQRDEVIGPLHGWNAHDYRPEDLAAFFRKARAEKFPLGAEELSLEQLLIERGVIVAQGAKISPGKGALISISRESPAYLRRTFIVHESTHALYFADPEYRAFVQGRWKDMQAGEKWFWKRYFQWMVYDTSSEYLMANEYQAYLLQQSLVKAKDYFTKNLPANLLVPEVLAREPDLRERVESYMKEYGESFEQRAAELETWLARKYGIAAGKTYFLE